MKAEKKASSMNKNCYFCRSRKGCRSSKTGYTNYACYAIEDERKQPHTATIHFLYYTTELDAKQAREHLSKWWNYNCQSYC